MPPMQPQRKLIDMIDQFRQQMLSVTAQYEQHMAVLTNELAAARQSYTHLELRNTCLEERAQLAETWAECNASEEDLRVALTEAKRVIDGKDEEIAALRVDIGKIARELAAMKRQAEVPITAAKQRKPRTITPHAPRICAVAWCGESSFVHGLCTVHASRQRQHGDPYLLKRPLKGHGWLLHREVREGVFALVEEGAK